LLKNLTLKRLFPKILSVKDISLISAENVINIGIWRIAFLGVKIGKLSVKNKFFS